MRDILPKRIYRWQRKTHEKHSRHHQTLANYVFIYLPILYCLGYCSCYINKAIPSTLFFFFKIALITLIFLPFHIHVMILSIARI